MSDSKAAGSDLAMSCLCASRTLSYNGNQPEARAKFLLREAAHEITRHRVRIVGGKSIADGQGRKRRLTLRERLAIWLLEGRTEVRP